MDELIQNGVIPQDEESLVNLRINLTDLNRFISKISALRQAQTSYLKERNYRVLTQVKALESEVDNRYYNAVKAAANITSLLNNIINHGLKQQTNTHNSHSSSDCQRNNQNSACTKESEGANLFSN